MMPQYLAHHIRREMGHSKNRAPLASRGRERLRSASTSTNRNLKSNYEIKQFRALGPPFGARLASFLVSPTQRIPHRSAACEEDLLAKAYRVFQTE
jgi:hypothetical protein